MSLNIKNPETHALVRQLAERTGESMTEAVTIAVRQRLDRLGRSDADIQARLAAIEEIARRVAPHMSEEARTIDHADLLYDESGLPRGD
ncbi:MAG TPA: type II toxin-antitoxin system VapB family antitoxin [Sporichthyaceae bacterium]|jgi:antitoxin VapB|nr:type II toxin-antitoxin system VapB family antitoxin [Sporichthyaceae bacterium]